MLRALLSLPRSTAALVWLSLVLNVFLASAIATHWFAPAPAVRDMPDRPIARLIAKLPPADARIVREAQRSLRPQLAAARAEYERALAAAGSIVAREPLDPAAVTQALEAVRRSRQAITDVRVQLYAQVIPRLSAQGRQLITAAD
jgi:uncharacterized membrane protein